MLVSNKAGETPLERRARIVPDSHGKLLDDLSEAVVLLNVRQLARVDVNRGGAWFPYRAGTRLYAERHWLD